MQGEIAAAWAWISFHFELHAISLPGMPIRQALEGLAVTGDRVLLKDAFLRPELQQKYNFIFLGHIHAPESQRIRHR